MAKLEAGELKSLHLSNFTPRKLNFFCSWAALIEMNLVSDAESLIQQTDS